VSPWALFRMCHCKVVLVSHQRPGALCSFRQKGIHKRVRRPFGEELSELRGFQFSGSRIGQFHTQLAPKHVRRAMQRFQRHISLVGIE